MICVKSPCGVWHTTGIQEMSFPLLLVTLPSSASITLNGTGRILEQKYWHSFHRGTEVQSIITSQTISHSHNQQGKDTCQEAKIGLVIRMESGDQCCKATSVSIHIFQSFHWSLQNLSQIGKQQESHQICWKNMGNKEDYCNLLYESNQECVSLRVAEGQKHYPL